MLTRWWSTQSRKLFTDTSSNTGKHTPQPDVCDGGVWGAGACGVPGRKIRGSAPLAPQIMSVCGVVEVKIEVCTKEFFPALVLHVFLLTSIVIRNDMLNAPLSASTRRQDVLLHARNAEERCWCSERNLFRRLLVARQDSGCAACDTHLLRQRG